MKGGVPTGGVWLAVASFSMIAVLALHGPIAPHLDDQMMRVAHRPAMWSFVHWLAAAALSLYAVAGLVILTSRSRLTETFWTTTAWAVLPVGAIWTLTTAVAEATVVANAAAAGDAETFREWWAFAEGKGNGFAILALAVAVIAHNEAMRAGRLTPAWAAWVGMVAGIASFGGWALGMWFGVAPGNLVWVASTILMSAWIAWFGLSLSRSAPD
jgi:hypothetical protein